MLSTILRINYKYIHNISFNYSINALVEKIIISIKNLVLKWETSHYLIQTLIIITKFIHEKSFKNWISVNFIKSMIVSTRIHFSESKITISFNKWSGSWRSRSRYCMRDCIIRTSTTTMGKILFKCKCSINFFR